MFHVHRWVGISGLLVATATGCGATVTLYGDGQGGEGAEEGGASPTPCVDPPPSGVPSASLRIDGPASVVAGRIHLTGTVDGEEGYFIARYEEGALWLPSAASDMSGEARWVPFFGGRHARVRGGDGALPLSVELLDASDPDAPIVALEKSFEGAVPEPYRGTFTAHGDWLYFCHHATPEEKPTLVRLDPGLTSLIPATHNGCRSFHQASAARAGLLMSWTIEEDSNGGAVTLSDLALDGEPVASFSFAGTGIHQYGSITGGDTDGARAVVSVENDDWMLAFGAKAETGTMGPYVAFAPAGPKRLLTVLDELAYFLTPNAVVAYDLHEMTAPKLVVAKAESELDPTTTTFVAAMADVLLVRDAAGEVWSVPRSLTGPVIPTPTYLGEPVTLPPPCTD
ncbi:MAG: hypothetical protein R3B72_18650 [Polyangiaceae bacterium]